MAIKLRNDSTTIPQSKTLQAQLTNPKASLIFLAFRTWKNSASSDVVSLSTLRGGGKGGQVRISQAHEITKPSRDVRSSWNGSSRFLSGKGQRSNLVIY